MSTYDPFSLIAPQFFRNEKTQEVVSSNERNLLAHIWRKPNISRAELMARLSLTQQSIHRLVDQLYARDIIKFGDMKPPNGKGKPSPALMLNSRFAFSIGISVNTDKAGIALMRLSGDHVTRSVDIDQLNMEQALQLIEATVDGLISKESETRANLFGVGFGISGYAVGGTSYNAPLPLQSWSLIELGPLLSRRFNAPVWVENGANTAAISEAMFGAGRYCSDFGYLSFNYGFGGALVLGGELWRGSNGNAGELSGLFDDVQTKRRPALKLLIDRLAQNGIMLETVGELKNKFDPTWPGVQDWVDEVAPAHNMIVSALCAVLDPELIVYGGEVPPKLADMFKERTDFFNRPRYGVARNVAKLVNAQVTEDASAIGAAVLPLKASFF